MISNLVLHHPFAVLGIAGLVSMLAVACIIQAGSVLHRRFQRAAIQRSLDKVEWHKIIPAILLSFCLLTSQLAFAQTAPPPKATPQEQYQRLLVAVSIIMAHMKQSCKSEACVALIAEGTPFVADAQEKNKKGLLVDEERTEFHKKLNSFLTRTREALQVEATKEDPKGTTKLQIPEGLSCPAGKPGLKTVVYDQDRCDLCYQVFEQAFSICTLYLGICQTCALICMSVATLQFGNCIERFCDGA
jgi:hypothetical protein